MRLGERRKFRTTSHLSSRPVIVNSLRFLWIIIVIWGELGIFFWSLSSCTWPDPDGNTEKPTHVLLISDSQVRPPGIVWKQGAWLGTLRQFVFDLNLKKSWHVTSRMHPHVVIFLGDMLASGKSVENQADYDQYVQKFRSIFVMGRPVPFYYIPGNNDVGMGVSSYSRSVRSHYLRTFGPFNQEVVIRNHTFVLLDAPGLVDEDYQRAAKGLAFDHWRPIPEGTISFVESVVHGQNPLVLLSHIPLSRPDSASCGPLREKGTIRRGVGHGYQNTLGKQTTAYLLKTLRPYAIFSGDNRDYCELTHAIGDDKTREVTVKSFSMANSIRNPGFQLLSLSDPSIHKERSLADRPCFLPDQCGIYSSLYLPLIILNALGLLLFNVYKAHQGRIPRLEPLSLSPRHRGPTTSTAISSGSPVWSPYSLSVPASPQTSLPSYLRTPHAPAGPTFRAASRPATPQGSPLLAPVVYFPEDDDEALYPTHYAIQRESRPHDDWSPGHEEAEQEEHDITAPVPRFTSAPGWKPVEVRGWLWTWTFVLRGRRRRMTVRVPPFTRNKLFGISKFLKKGESLRRRHGLIQNSAMDMLAVLWPTVLVWVFLTWLVI